MILDLYVCHDIVFAAEEAKSFFSLPNVKRRVFLWISAVPEKCKPVPIHAEEQFSVSSAGSKQAIPLRESENS